MYTEVNGKTHTVETFMDWCAWTALKQRDEAAAGTPIAHSILDCAKTKDECDEYATDVAAYRKARARAYLRATGQSAKDFEDLYRGVCIQRLSEKFSN
ncbi:MAG TPA: hypothetical protein VKB53_04540 [Gammaproteobacteria bacterium]|nr:hypothetical protein [Gammaproteobacteria bacterium]